MLRISKQLDRWIEATKWPAAALAMLSLPLTVIAIATQAYNALSAPVYSVMFAAGIGLVAFAARTSLGRSRFVRILFRWVHDFTQAFIATLLLHPVMAIRGKESSPERSRVRWLGRGNWVLLVAPYTFPLFALAVWFPSMLLFASLRSAAVGFGLGLHLSYLTYHFWHGTSELKRLGSRFCWMFLPAANLLVAGMLFAFAVQGFLGVWNFMVDWITLPGDTWDLIRNWLNPTIPQETTK